MKKLLALLFFVPLFILPLSAQAIEEDDFDFDSLFEDAEDVEEPVVEEVKKNDVPIVVAPSAFSSMVRFSGSFSGDVGMAYINDQIDETEDEPNGYFTFTNTLNMTVKPSNEFVLHGSVETGVSTGFNISVSSLYFDYLLYNHLYITAGKKSISWGNLRLFNSSTYYLGNKYAEDKATGPVTVGKYLGYLWVTGPLYASNIFAEDGAPYSIQLRWPWSFGTLTFATTSSSVSSLEKDSLNYYGSVEFSVLNTNINFYAKRPEKNSGKKDGKPNPDITWKNNIFGLEVKRTILGFDVYAQGLARIKDYKNLIHSVGYDYITATAGLYRLWDSFDPNIGFNIEYQHEFNPALSPRNIDRIAFEGGIKRIGSKKNMKFGVLSHYNITEKYGYTGLSYIISGIAPYADWTNKFAIGYGSKYENGPVFLYSSAVTLTLDY